MFILHEEIKILLRDPGTIKILATVNDQGVPHAVRKETVEAGDGESLMLPERFESSRTNSNLVHSLWFGRRAALTLLAEDGRAFEILAAPVQCHITGPLFERYYRRMNSLMAALWILRPEEARNETPRFRQAEEEAAHPLFLHPDRIAKEERLDP
ncbi:MAG: hypothetical protein LBP80_11095 [Treponema sp.]|jgi:hypothetical protein|nr:hypothetical protein [Treponema sp.]